jgi:hypothetical protein
MSSDYNPPASTLDGDEGLASAGNSNMQEDPVEGAEDIIGDIDV